MPSSLLETAAGVELEEAGWLTTTEKVEKKRDLFESFYMAYFFATERVTAMCL